MAKYNIFAGTMDDITLDSNQWLIIDVGYSKRNPTNAIWRSDGFLESMYFCQAKRHVIATARLNPDQPLHLAIEAPLSAAFDNCGPATRLCDKWRNPDTRRLDTKSWVANAGASTLLLAEFLLRNLHEEKIGPRPIKLFEGHVSFKYKQDHEFRFRGVAEDKHQADVLAIRHEIEHRNEANIFDETRLRQDENLTFKSPFGFLNEDLIPPVIRVPPPRHFK